MRLLFYLSTVFFPIFLLSQPSSPEFKKSQILEDLFLWDRSYRTNCEIEEWGEVEKRDKINQQILKNFFIKYGYPECIDSLSTNAYFGFYYTIQHAGIELMEQNVNQIKLLADCGHLEMKKYAMTIDRIYVRKYGVQVYGEQFYHDTLDNYLKYFPFQNKDSVQIKRMQIGLDSLDFEKRVRVIIKK